MTEKLTKSDIGLQVLDLHIEHMKEVESVYSDGISKTLHLLGKSGPKYLDDVAKAKKVLQFTILTVTDMTKRHLKKAKALRGKPLDEPSENRDQ